MKTSSLLKIDVNVCQACPRCAALKVCRMKAIVQIDPGELPYLDEDRCRDCRYCIPACPFGAIQKGIAGGFSPG